jgi:pyrroloquinoline quinone (PQQ) biosynthesis protein C
MNSAHLIYRGTSREFVDSLCLEAKSHRALTHPYFDLFHCLTRSEADEALRDFIYQYSFYSRHFDAYNEAVLTTVNIPAYRAVIEENIADEQGSGKPGFEGLPHRKMFARFAERIGINDRYRALHNPITTAMVWGELFLQKCSSPIPGVGLSAISIGTEFIVPDVYNHILELINKSSFFNIEENYFFTLHSECDVEHSQQLIELLYDFCEDKDCREAVRFGAMSALNLRTAFFDVMAARLEEIRCKSKTTMHKIYTTAPQLSGVEIAHAAYPI